MRKETFWRNEYGSLKFQWELVIILGVIAAVTILFMVAAMMKTDERKEELAKIDEMGCGELKHYILDDVGYYEEYAKERFVWLCEK